MVFIVQKRLTVGIEEAMVLQEVAVKLESEVQELLASQADAWHLAVAAPHSLPKHYHQLFKQLYSIIRHKLKIPTYLMVK